MTIAAPEGSGVTFPPPFIYLIGLLLGIGVNRLIPLPFLPGHLVWLVGGAFIVAWLAVMIPAVTSFGRAKTPINPTKPVTALVTTGIFGITRNPMYVSLALLYLGIACITNSLWAIIFLIPVLMIVRVAVIAREERYLDSKFGDEYRRYKSKVRRWL